MMEISRLKLFDFSCESNYLPLCEHYYSGSKKISAEAILRAVIEEDRSAGSLATGGRLSRSAAPLDAAERKDRKQG